MNLEENHPAPAGESAGPGPAESSSASESAGATESAGPAGPGPAEPVSGGEDRERIARLEAEIAKLRAELSAQSGALAHGDAPTSGGTAPTDATAAAAATVAPASDTPAGASAEQRADGEDEPWKPRPEDSLAGKSWTMSTPTMISWVVFTVVGMVLFAISVFLPESVSETIIGAARFTGVVAMLIGGIAVSFGAISRLLGSDSSSE